MSTIVDNLIAYKVLRMLVTPFDQTAAFHLGIIDAHGKILRKTSQLSTQAERDAYNYLTRLVFNMKRIINKLPGGESKLKSIVAALWLVKECYASKDRTTSLMEQKYLKLLEKLESQNIVLVEEEIEVTRFLAKLSEDGGAGGAGGGAVGGAPANATGAAVSTNEPKIGKKDIKSYKKRQPGVIAGMATRKPPVEVA